MNQLALVLRNDGIAKAADHAEDLEPGWGASAYRVLCDFARHRVDGFTSEDFRAFLASIQFPCPVPKALGQVMLRAARAKVIEKAGYGVSQERHLSPTVLWRPVA